VHHRHAHEGRVEFGRLYVSSLIASAERAAERRHMLGRRTARRRIERLRDYAAERQRSLTTPLFDPPRALLVIVSVLWLVAASALAVVETSEVRVTVRSATNIALLVVSMLWFLVAILCVPTRRHDS